MDSTVIQRIVFLLGISVIIFLLLEDTMELLNGENIADISFKNFTMLLINENTTLNETNADTGCDPNICRAQNHTNSNEQFPGITNLPVSNATNANQTFPYHLDVVVYLSGELGNHLQKIFTGFALKCVGLEMEKPIKIRFHWLNQNIRKSHKTAKELQTCFPNFKNENLYECNVPAFAKIKDQQNRFFDSNTTFLELKSEDYELSPEGFKQRLQRVANVIDDGKTIPFHHMQHLFQDDDTLSLSIPFISADKYANFNLVDRYYDVLIDLFRFDEDACCKAVPDPDETVLHHRGMMTEMPRMGHRLKSYELGPNQTAYELLGHLKPGDKVALLSRFQNTLVPFKEALERRGIKARIISGQTGPQDFCFLMKATKEITGIAWSSYVAWASILSSTVKRSILYCNTFRAESCSYKWQHPKLKSRFLHPIYEVKV